MVLDARLRSGLGMKMSPVREIRTFGREIWRAARNSQRWNAIVCRPGLLLAYTLLRVGPGVEEG